MYPPSFCSPLPYLGTTSFLPCVLFSSVFIFLPSLHILHSLLPSFHPSLLSPHASSSFTTSSSSPPCLLHRPFLQPSLSSMHPSPSFLISSRPPLPSLPLPLARDRSATVSHCHLVNNSNVWRAVWRPSGHRAFRGCGRKRMRRKVGSVAQCHPRVAKGASGKCLMTDEASIFPSTIPRALIGNMATVFSWSS